MALLLIFLCSQVAAVPGTWERDVRAIAAPHRFSYLTWHLRQYGELLRPRATPAAAVADPAGYVLTYYSLQSSVNALRATPEPVPDETRARLGAMRPIVERILAAQVAQAFREERIHTPLDRFARLPGTFPPLWFALEPPPHLLVVSPRTHIASIRQELLVQVMDTGTMEEIEGAIEELDLSALVVELGGLGATYPAMVSDRSSLRYSIETVAEEWLHQYLAFTPLGWRYVMHLLEWSPDYEVAQINESLASIIVSEIGDAVWARHYAPRLPEPPPASGDAAPAGPVFDFRAFMRETRLTAEVLLAEGAVDEAEAWMENRRQSLMAQGYRIRKLNQAYFAFHGTYADAPGAITPIGDQLRALRATSPSLGAYLNTTSTIRRYDDLLRLLEEHGAGVAANGMGPANP